HRGIDRRRTGRQRDRRVAAVARPHRREHREMPAGGRPAHRDPRRVYLEACGVGFDPADAVTDVDEAARISIGALPEVERDNDKTELREISPDADAVFEIASLPTAAMQIDQARKWAGVAAGHEHARHQRALAVTQIAVVSDSGREDLRPRYDRVGHPWGLSSSM